MFPDTQTGGGESRLAEGPSNALDGFCGVLTALPDTPGPLAWPELILAGLEAACDAARNGGPLGQGFWMFRFEPMGGAGGRLTLRREGADAAVVMQLDADFQPQGAFHFYLSGQDHAFAVEQVSGNWSFQKRTAGRQIDFALPSGCAVPWQVAPPADMWGAGGQGGGGLNISSDFAPQPPPEAEAKWHYVVDGVTEGPVTEAVLRKILTNLGPDALVWNQGMPSWAPARDAGVYSERAAEPPAPAPAAPAAAEPDPFFAALQPDPAGPALAGRGGPAAGFWYMLIPRTRVGSGEECQVRLHDASVAPVHALMMEKPDGFWIADNRTLAGTFVNGTRTQGPVKLAPGDIVRLGECELEFRPG